MGKLRRQYNQEFKEQLVEEIILGGATVSQISREHQLHPVLIYNWIRQYRQGDIVSTKTQREKELDKEVKELKQKIGELVMELEHLKKLRVYVQRNKKESISVITKGNLGQLRRGVK